MRPLIPAVLVVLAACATPRDACLRASLSEIATLDRLIVETEGNLARGYRIEREPVVSTGLDFCLGRGIHDSGVRIGLRYCNSVETRYREVEVAIDPDAERRKLTQLRGKRAEESRLAQAQAASCPPA
ncbi:MAG: hypothetical protein AAF646_10430 [Pseudomonadota bacterium]